VHPNPATDKITVQINDTRAKLKSYLLYDAKGNFINQQALDNYPETVDIDTNNLLTGTYYLVLELQGGERAVQKIMIKR
ncbi:MAG: T9SS type A sorting domain-containing protein, partial [Bacteroidota bacterium]